MNKKTYTIDIDSVEECQNLLNNMKSILGQSKPTPTNKKVFDVDFDSMDECKHLFNIIKSRIGELKCNSVGSKNQKKKEQYDACYNIYNADISDLYSDLNLNESKKYYVYTHSEQYKKIAVGKCGITTFAASLGMTHIPFYVGKGIGSRANDLNRNETHRKIRQKLKKFDKDIVVEIVKDNLTEKEALILESKLIDIFGLLPNGGRLVNLDEGIKSDERKLRYIKQLSKINSLYKELLSNR